MEHAADTERFKKQMDFITEIDKSKQIFRQTYITDGTRKENDAEHSWHLALMAAVFAEYANEPIDVGRTMLMVLIHDIVEIDAGDTYAYDDAANLTKRDRELAAADRIFGLLPDDQAEQLRGLWDEFEAAKTPEARFANTLDKTQPVILNDASGGKGWTEHGVVMSQILKRNKSTPSGSEALWENAYERIERNVKLGNITDDREQED